jgi:hypothetical protein
MSLIDRIRALFGGRESESAAGYVAAPIVMDQDPAGEPDVDPPDVGGGDTGGGFDAGSNSNSDGGGGGGGGGGS